MNIHQIITPLFIGSVALGVAAYSRENREIVFESSVQSQPRVKNQAGRQLVPPEPQTTLLSDTDMENALMDSLRTDPDIKQKAAVESVNCVKARCQVLVNPLDPEMAPHSAFYNHMSSHPEFGRALLVTRPPATENKTLLTFIYSQETHVSTTH